MRRLITLALLVASGASAREPAKPPSGTLDKDVITAAINEKLQDVQKCAEASMVKQPDGPPKVQLVFTIGVDGKVSEAHLEGTPPPDEKYGACVLEVVRSIRPKKKPVGGPVTVSYPLLICGVGF